jgi:hypothetical protein
VIIIVRALIDWFIDVQIALMNLEVKPTVRVGTNPSLICHRSALGAIIRERHKLAFGALTAFWPSCYYHRMFSS